MKINVNIHGLYIQNGLQTIHDLICWKFDPRDFITKSYQMAAPCCFILYNSFRRKKICYFNSIIYVIKHIRRDKSQPAIRFFFLNIVTTLKPSWVGHVLRSAFEQKNFCMRRGVIVVSVHIIFIPYFYCLLLFG